MAQEVCFNDRSHAHLRITRLQKNRHHDAVPRQARHFVVHRDDFDRFNKQNYRDIVPLPDATQTTRIKSHVQGQELQGKIDPLNDRVRQT